MVSKKKNMKLHFRKRSIERVGMIIDEKALVKRIQNQELEFVYSQSLRRKVYRVEISEQKYFVIYDKSRKQLITIFPEKGANIPKKIIIDVEPTILERCKQLPKILVLEDCKLFYKKFNDLNLLDINCSYSYCKKILIENSIETLTMKQILLAFSTIEMENYINAQFEDEVYKKYLSNGIFEKLYERLQELIFIAGNNDW